MNDWYANGGKPSEKKDCPEEHSGTGLVTEANEDRAGALDEFFGTLPAASAAERALINQNFATPESSRRTAHSPLLQKKAGALVHIRDEPTLTENVRMVLRRA